jgi:CRISPR-associated protein Csx17
MTLHLHHITGCAPTPLAHYLKALGVLRIVAEQADPDARGWWQDEHFCLLTALDRAAVETFFLERYAPTAVVSPWNRGSGFYGKTDPALDAIEKSEASRFAPFRVGIAAARVPLDQIVSADSAVRALKDRTKGRSRMTAPQKAAAAALKEDLGFKRELATAEKRFEQLKADLFSPLLRTWRGGHRAWLDAAVVVLDDGRVSWPALVGTGGAGGRLDFTNNVMLRLGQLFELTSPAGHPTPPSSGLLASALWALPSNDLTVGSAIGQFLPGSAGGANSTTAPDGASLVNPWVGQWAKGTHPSVRTADGRAGDAPAVRIPCKLPPYPGDSGSPARPVHHRRAVAPPRV